MSDNKTFSTYVDNMNTLLTMYDDGRQIDAMKYEDCGGKLNVIRSDFAGFFSDHLDVTAPSSLLPPCRKPRWIH